jgi:hypothetical protein
MGYELEDDESLNDTIQLPEVLIYKEKWIPMQETILLLQSRVKPILMQN